MVSDLAYSARACVEQLHLFCYRPESLRIVIKITLLELI